MSIGKISVLVLWVVLGGAFLAPPASTYASVGRLVFWITLAAHVVECAVFYPRVRASQGSVASNLALIFLYGVFHVRELSPA